MFNLGILQLVKKTKGKIFQSEPCPVIKVWQDSHRICHQSILFQHEQDFSCNNYILFTYYILLHKCRLEYKNPSENYVSQSNMATGKAHKLIVYDKNRNISRVEDGGIELKTDKNKFNKQNTNTQTQTQLCI